MRRLAPCLAALALLAIALVPTGSRAEMWCADPVAVHEWGVQVFAAGGAQRATAPGPSLPAFFHAATGAPGAAGSPVRDMPVDGGMRELPVVHFYAGPNWRPVPIGIEVGFTHGEATRWYPQVDVRRAAVDANGGAARAARQRLLATRRGRVEGQGGPPTGGDPTRQLAWDHLVLTEQPRHTPAATREPWITRARGFGEALWVNGASESERFLFYEGRTRETPALTVARGPTHASGRRHLLLQNGGSHPVHDVFFVHREGGRTYVFHTPSIPAGRHAGFVIEEHLVAAAQLRARTRDALRARLVDAAQPAPGGFGWSDCVMMRDPALPFEQAEGHALYAHEVDAVLDAWAARLFGQGNGTTVVYREDVAYLDAEMPLGVYSDMYHHARIRRLGLALMENVSLP